MSDSKKAYCEVCNNITIIAKLCELERLAGSKNHSG